MNKKIFLIVSMLTAMTLSMSSCSNDGSEPNNDSNEEAQTPTYVEEDVTPFDDSAIVLTDEVKTRTIQQANEFSYRLFDAIDNDVASLDNKNVFISPVSVSMVLSMLADGAQGTTLNELANVLGFDADNIDAYGKANLNLISELSTDRGKSEYSPESEATFQIANALWLNKSVDINATYKSKNVHFYKAAIRNLDFSSNNSVNLINDWVSQKTNGLIPEIIKSIDPTAVLYASNAVYFKSNWSDAFSEENQSAKFTNYDGTISDVKYLYGLQNYGLIETDKCEVVGVDMGYNSFEFQLVIPKDGVSVGDAVNSLANTDLSNSTGDLARLYFPQFKIENDLDLINYLKNMGIISAFSGSANFSGISDTSLFINMLKHVTNISVDKKGIEAAAATITGMVGSNIDTPVNYRTIRVDHPFAFIIRDIKTNSILFIGAVNKI